MKLVMKIIQFAHNIYIQLFFLPKINILKGNFVTKHTPNPWLTLILVLGKSRVNQKWHSAYKWNLLIKKLKKSALVKEFLFYSTC